MAQKLQSKDKQIHREAHRETMCIDVHRESLTNIQIENHKKKSTSETQINLEMDTETQTDIKRGKQRKRR